MINERRGAPRYEAKAHEIVVLPFPHHVKVLDISAAGVLLHSTHPVDLGTRGSLRLNLDGTPLQVAVEVRRVSTSGAGKDVTYRLGARFIGISPEHQRLIERFANH